MATRGAIVRINEDMSFKGVYHHWDGYPDGLGQTLLDLFNSYFDRNLEFMLKTLIDDHPAGWSTINGKNFMEPPGFNEWTPQQRSEKYLELNNPQCYCHGDRSEEGWEVTQDNASGSGVEYVYAFDEKNGHMYILSSYLESGDKMVGFFGMGDPNATWKPMECIDLAHTEQIPKIHE
jgi:hypothetical protein